MIQINCSEKQANVIVKALDLYSRLHAGQFDELRWLDIRDFDDKLLNRDTIDCIIELVRREFKGAYHGINSNLLPDSAKIAYEIRKCIDHDISWHHNPKGGYTVNYDMPLKVSKEKLPEIKILIDEE